MAFTSSYTDKLIQQSQFFYGTPLVQPDLSGSFSGSFQGDGTNLNLASNTTIPASNPFPLTASSAAIISRSIAASDTDSTALRLFGSGSISESGIFEVEGSAGPLFSVADGLDGVLMEVNNISGLPLFQVSSSNEVFVNRGNLTSGVTTATASFAMFSGSFQGNASQLTNISAGSITTAFTNITSSGDISASGQIIGTGLTASALTAGEVVFVGTGGALSSDAGMTYDASTDRLTVQNLTAVHLTSSFITSSQIHTSGSNIFGDDTTDTQTLIGTTKMTGSAEVTGSLNVSGDIKGGRFLVSNIQFANYHPTTETIRLGWTGDNTLIYGETIKLDANVTASGAISSSGAISAGSLTIDSKPTIDTFTSTIEELTLNPTGDWAAIRLNRDSYPKPIIVEGSITSSYNVSSSAASTASFGHYLGDGSQLTNLPTQDPFPFTGDAQITGSLTISGSLIPSTNPPNRQNVVIGQDAALSLADNASYGITNVIVGYEAAHDANQLNNSVLLGWKAGYAIDNGTNNIGIGKSALGSTTTRGNSIRYNIGVGEGSGANLQGGLSSNYDEYNILMGIYSGANLYSNDGNYNNILIGHYNKGLPSSGTLRNSLKIGQTTSGNVTIFPISASLDSGSVLIPQLKVDSVNTANSASGTTLSVEGSGSTVFEVIGSEGTLFSVDDDLDGVIFTANDRSGLPVLEASASGEVYIGKAPQSLYTTAVISSNNANVTQSIYGLDTSSYGGAFFEYTAHSGSNARAGNIMAVWNPSDENLDVDMSFNETTTLDIGNTENLIMKVHVSESQAQLAAFSTTAGYNIKTIIRSI